MGVGSAPLDDNGRAVLALWNDATGLVVPLHIGAIVTGADGKSYAKLDVDATVGTVTAQGSPDGGTTLKTLKTTSDGTQVTNATWQPGQALAGGAMDYNEMVARGLAGNVKVLNGSIAITNNGGSVAVLNSWKDQLNNTYSAVTTGKTLYVAAVGLICDISTTAGVIQSSICSIDDGSAATNIKYKTLVTGATQPVLLRGLLSFTQTTVPTVRVNPSNLATAIGFVYAYLLGWEE